MFDAKKFPAIDMANPPKCKDCDARLERLDTLGIWQCSADGDACDNEDCWTDAQLDNRLTNEAEAAFERQQERGGFLSPDACQRSYER